MVKGYLREHEIFWDIDCGRWRFVDNRQFINHERPCKRCGNKPTEEGHDNCLGTIPGIKNACCGHGIEGEAYQN